MMIGDDEVLNLQLKDCGLAWDLHGNIGLAERF